MSLIACPDCDTQMSDQAIDCPSCGYHVGSYRPWWHWLVLGGLLALVAFIGYSMYDANKQADEDLKPLRCGIAQINGEFSEDC